MAGPAAERSSSPAATDRERDWRDRARHQWRRCLLLLAHWRMRVAVARRLLGQTLRQTWRSLRRHGSGGDDVAPLGDANRALLPSVADVRSLPTPADTTEPPTDDGSAPAGSLPEVGHRGRELPSGEGVLEVERTPDRLIMSDPADEEAYLASTVWVQVEE